ncbi:phosphopantetheine-binding protein [Arenibaculum sp.]|jgi:acyl carrier protein|uniref:phosphopantetheine-binding protein n=1 Tax=Arenibaculum sp. TaxID=2865862 RepID=UPI002E133FC5|nr:phosphopantetheine-binding protein [Arenibaculum sp.]
MSANAATADIEADVISMWEEFFGKGSVSADDDFFELGGNSLTAVKFLSRVEEKYGMDALPPETLFETPALRDVVASIAQNAKKAA